MSWRGIPTWAWPLGLIVLGMGVEFWRRRNRRVDSDGDGDPTNDWQDDAGDVVAENLPGSKRNNKE